MEHSSNLIDVALETWSPSSQTTYGVGWTFFMLFLLYLFLKSK